MRIGTPLLLKEFDPCRSDIWPRTRTVEVLFAVDWLVTFTRTRIRPYEPTFFTALPDIATAKLPSAQTAQHQNAHQKNRQTHQKQNRHAPPRRYEQHLNRTKQAMRKPVPN